MFKLLLISLIFLVSTAQASSTPEKKGFYDKNKEGYYWYKEEKKPKKPKPKRVLPSLKDYKEKQLWDMHPDDFQKLLMDFQKKAVMSPTEENVYEYLKIQDIARRRALAYTNVVSLVTQKHPELSFVEREYPITAPAKVAMTQLQNEEIDRKLQNAEDYGLIYFYSPDCKFCQAQSGILRYFLDQYHWEISYINIDQNPNIASRFGVQRVPSLILIKRDRNDYIPISSGVISVNELKRRLYRSIRLMNGEITPEEYNLYEYQERIKPEGGGR